MAVLQEKGQLLNVMIRQATPNDFAVIRKIGRMAGAAFEQYDMSEIANNSNIEAFVCQMGLPRIALF